MQLKQKLENSDRKISMEICVIPSAVVTQAIASVGVDAVIIDQEHGAVGREALHAMIAATAGTECAPLVRISEMGDANVKHALDMGAEGIVFPLVKTAEDARNCVASMRYPSNGARGWGPFIAHSRWQTPIMEYLPNLGERTVCCLLLETKESLDNLDAILAVEGVDCVFVAQFDLSTSLGVSGQFDHPDFKAAVAKIEAAALNAKVPLGGGPARSKEEADALFVRGYRMIAGFDVLRLKASVAASLEWTK
ncbi:MAG: HpcH/HpaI aldolase/citrate lyase family protein [Hyphomicrobiales bacterium]